MAVGIARWGITVYNMVSYDRPWWAGVSFTLSILEPNLGIICACVATFSPLAQLSYAKSKHWANPNKDSSAIEKAPDAQVQRHQDAVPTMDIDNPPAVVSATVYPTNVTPFPYSPDHLRATELDGARQVDRHIQHSNIQHTGNHRDWPSTHPNHLPPNDIVRSTQDQPMMQRIGCRDSEAYDQVPGHVTGYTEDNGLPDQFPAGSSHPAYYTEFPSDIGQADVNNPVYYGASWPQYSQPNHTETCTSWQHYTPDTALYQGTLFTQRPPEVLGPSRPLHNV